MLVVFHAIKFLQEKLDNLFMNNANKDWKMNFYKAKRDFNLIFVKLIFKFKGLFFNTQHMIMITQFKSSFCDLYQHLPRSDLFVLLVL